MFSFPHSHTLLTSLAVALSLAACGGGGGGGTTTPVASGGGDTTAKVSVSTAGYWTGTYQVGTTSLSALMPTSASQYGFLFTASGDVDVVTRADLPPMSDGANATYTANGIHYKNTMGRLETVGKTLSRVSDITAGKNLTAPISQWNWDVNGAEPQMDNAANATGKYVLTNSTVSDRVITMAEVNGNYMPFMNSLGKFDTGVTSFNLDSTGKITATFADGCSFLGDAALNDQNQKALIVNGTVFGNACANQPIQYIGNGVATFGQDGKINGLLVAMLDIKTFKTGILFHLVKQ